MFLKVIEYLEQSIRKYLNWLRKTTKYEQTNRVQNRVLELKYGNTKLMEIQK